MLVTNYKGDVGYDERVYVQGSLLDVLIYTCRYHFFEIGGCVFIKLI